MQLNWADLIFAHMKTAASLILMMFVIFLSTPTIVGLIEKSTDTSYFFSMTEEELSHKEVKAELRIEPHEFVNLSGNTSGIILSENLSRHDNVCGSIFIPPPELA